MAPSRPTLESRPKVKGKVFPDGTPLVIGLDGKECFTWKLTDLESPWRQTGKASEPQAIENREMDTAKFYSANCYLWPHEAQVGYYNRARVAPYFKYRNDTGSLLMYKRVEANAFTTNVKEYKYPETGKIYRFNIDYMDHGNYILLWFSENSDDSSDDDDDLDPDDELSCTGGNLGIKKKRPSKAIKTTEAAKRRKILPKANILPWAFDSGLSKAPVSVTEVDWTGATFIGDDTQISGVLEAGIEAAWKDIRYSLHRCALLPEAERAGRLKYVRDAVQQFCMEFYNTYLDFAIVTIICESASACTATISSYTEPQHILFAMCGATASLARATREPSVKNLLAAVHKEIDASVSDHKAAQASENNDRKPTLDKSAVTKIVDETVTKVVNKAVTEAIDKAVTEAIDKAVTEAIDKVRQELLLYIGDNYKDDDQLDSLITERIEAHEERFKHREAKK